MTNASSSASFSRQGSLGPALKPLPVFAATKRFTRSGSWKQGSHEPNHLGKARVVVPGIEAFEEMFVASRQQFVATAYSILRNTEDAEDAVQNAFISGYLHLRNFQGRSALKTWFTRVVLNAALMIRRKRGPVKLVSAPDWAPQKGRKWVDEVPSPEPDPEMCWAKAEALGLIEDLTARLKPHLREAFLMHYGNDISASQARLLAGVSLATFKTRLFRARRQVISEAKRALVLRRHKRVRSLAS